MRGVNRKQVLSSLDLGQLRQVLIRDLRKIPAARVKRMLQSYRYYQLRIDCNLDQIQALRSRMQKVTVTYRDAPGGGNGADASELIAKIMKLETYLKEDTEKARYALQEVQFWIDSLEDYRERNVLQLRYIEGLDWYSISEKLYMNRRWVTRLHGRALKNLLKLAPKSPTDM